MKFRRLDDSTRKTLAFGALHVTLAIAIGYLLTGSFVLAGLMTLIEPALNTLAHHRFEPWWTRRHGHAPSWRKTLAFAAIHLGNALLVGYALTGSWVIAGAMALVEPAANAVALYAFDGWWARRRTRSAALAAA